MTERTDATRDCDVLIVGAGPTGLALAAQLHAMGVTPRIIDRNPDRVHESRALAVQPRTLEVLDSIGLAGALLGRGHTASGARLHAGRRAPLLPLGGTSLSDTAFPSLLFLSQAQTEELLIEHLAGRGVGVERGAELTSLQSAGDVVTCSLEHHDGTAERVRARYVAGCDGAHSAVRHLAGVPFDGAPYPQTFVLADVTVDGSLASDQVHVFVTGAGMLFFFPLGEPAPWRIIGLRPRAGAAATNQPPSLADVQAVTDVFTGGGLRLCDPVWLSHFQVHHRQARHYRAGRVFLAGDAAHVHSPAGAQGMNTGIQDAWNLGWKLALLARGVADPALLDSYEAERRPVGRFVLRFTDRATGIATSDSAAVRLARTRIAPRLLPVLLRFRKGRAYAFRTLSQLAISYRDSPAVEEGTDAPRAGPRAGDRLPNARIVRDGRESWLHELLASSAFTLILCGPASGWPDDDVAAIQERCGPLVAVHRLTGDAELNGTALARLGASEPVQYVVRPDGYIGFRNGGTDTSGAARYLARWLGSRLT